MQANRREFIKQASALTLGVSALSLSLTPSRLRVGDALLVQQLPLTSKNAHLLNRISFGINQQSMRRINRIGYRRTIEEQLNPDALDDLELEAYIDEHLPTVNQSIAQTRLQVRTREISRLRVADELATGLIYQSARIVS